MKRLIKLALLSAVFIMTIHAYALPTSKKNADANKKHPVKTQTNEPKTTTTNASTPVNALNNVNVSPEERIKIEEVVHQYLVQKPEVIVEAIQAFQRKQYVQAEQTVKQTQENAPSFANPLFHQAIDPFAGNPNGKVTIVEFFDYQCPHCVDMTSVLDNIIKSNADVRIVYKEFPIRGPLSDFASRAALAANRQGKYAEFSHALLANKQPLTQDLILGIAKSTGVDIEKLKADMNDRTVDSALKDNLKLAQNLKLFGTPAFFIGRSDASGKIKYVPGQMDQKALQTAIDEAKK